MTPRQADGASSGRDNQKLRTRLAIVEACRELIRSGRVVTMPEVARRALISEATAYRHFPDLVSLVKEALGGLWPSPAEALEPVKGSHDPVERIGFACEFLLRRVLAYEGSTRAVIAATVSRPDQSPNRPGFRFGLIDEALDPVTSDLPDLSTDQLAQLKLDLAAVVSADALFSLIDLCRVSADEAVASLVRTARTITQAALQRSGPGGDARIVAPAR